jgi:hypothetical protein
MLPAAISKVKNIPSSFTSKHLHFTGSSKTLKAITAIQKSNTSHPEKEIYVGTYIPTPSVVHIIIIN